MADPKQETILTDPALIRSILEKARRTRSQLKIYIPEIRDDFLSMIVDVDERGQYLYIDELSPEHGNSKLKHAKIFNAYSKLQGASIGFQSEMLRVINNGRQTSFCIKFPTEIQHRERRNSRRIPVAAGLGVVADVYAGDKEPITLDVADISAEGIGLLACTRDIKRIMRSAGSLTCTVYFPDEGDWTCEIEPCHGYRREDGERIQLGARFARLNGEQKAVLDRQLRFFAQQHMRKVMRG